ncbi:MAG: hypothetical protein RLN76_13725 [Phycisphaeraceae bacterium]
MQCLRYVILRHLMPGFPHIDLMIEDPHAAGSPSSMDPDARVLKTWRLAYEPSHWSNRPMMLTPLPDHRRAYLRRTGPIATGKGSVQQLGQGSVLAYLWTTTRILLEPVAQSHGSQWELRRLPASDPPTTSNREGGTGRHMRGRGGGGGGWQMRVIS